MTLPVLQTGRLRLREIEESDAEGLHAAYGDTEAMRFWDFPASTDVAQTKARIRGSLGVDRHWHGVWAITLGSGEFAGAINYHDREPRHRRLALGWILSPPFWHQGLMTEAAQAVLDHCFSQMNTHRVEATIEPENIASRKLATKLGFTQEASLRDWLWVSGQPRSVFLYSLLQPEWAGRTR
jgi:[ribosomal protein S5]-alanine N-acetyltransferase